MTELYDDSVSRGAMLQAQVQRIPIGQSEAREAAASGADEEALRRLVTTRAAATNGAIEVEARERARELTERVAFKDAETNAFQMMAAEERYIEQHYERRVDRNLAQTWSEWLTNLYYTIVRYGSLGLAVAVLAWVIMESGRSAMLSASFLHAAAYAGAIILMPSVLTALGAYSTDIRWHRRLLRLYSIPAVLCGAVWVVAAAILFTGINSGLGGGGLGSMGGGLFDDGNLTNAPDTIAGQMMEVLRALFIDQVFGPIVLICHIISDVYASAAIGMRQQIVHKTGRAVVPVLGAKYTKSCEMIDEHNRRCGPLKAELATLHAVIQHCEAVKEEAVEAFKAAVAAERVRLEKRREQAVAASTLDFLAEAENGKPVLRVVR